MKKLLITIFIVIQISMSLAFGEQKINEIENCSLSSDVYRSLDNKSLSCIINKDGKDIVFKDGIELGEGKMPNYSPDSKSFTFIKKLDGKEIIVKDGLELPKYDYIPSFGYSPDSKSFTYTAIKNGKQIIIKDGIELGEGSNLVYSPDSKSFTFVAYRNTDFIIKDGIELGEGIDPVYSSDSKNFIYSKYKDGKYTLIKNGIELGNKYYDSIQGAIFSIDGNSVVYKAKEGGSYFVVKDGIEFPKLNSPVLNILFSPDGKSIAYTIDNNDNVINEHIIFKDGVNIGVGSNPKYSTNGKEFSYLNKELKEITIKNDGSGETLNYNNISSRDKISLKKINNLLINKIKEISKGEINKEKIVYDKVIKLLDEKINNSKEDKIKNKYIYLESIFKKEFNYNK